MQRHETDGVSLVWGLIFLVIAAVSLTGFTVDVSIDPRWVFPLAMVALGGVALVISMSRLGRRNGERAASGSAASPRDLRDDGTQDTLRLRR